MVRLARNVLVPLVVLSLAGMASPAVLLAQSPAAESPGAECPTTTPEENEAIFEQYLAALDSGDEAQIDALLHDDFSHNLSRSGIDVPNEPGNADELEQYRNAGGADIEYTVDEVIAADDLVAVRYTYTVPPENVPDSTATEPIAVNAIALARIECGMVREAWVEADTLSLLLASGYQVATPTEGEASPAASPAA
jgi:ketosteroid isomerase-like protein